MHATLSAGQLPHSCWWAQPAAPAAVRCWDGRGSGQRLQASGAVQEAEGPLQLVPGCSKGQPGAEAPAGCACLGRSRGRRPLQARGRATSGRGEQWLRGQ